MKLEEKMGRAVMTARAMAALAIGAVLLTAAIVIAGVGVVFKVLATTTAVVSTLLVDGWKPMKRVAQEYRRIRLF